MSEVLSIALETLLPLVAAGAAWLLAQAARWAGHRVKSEYLQHVIDRAAASASLAVATVEQSYVSALRAAKAADSDGGRAITEAEAKEARDRALMAAKSYLGAKGLAELSKVLGLSGSDVDTYLSNRIEASLSGLAPFR